MNTKQILYIPDKKIGHILNPNTNIFVKRKISRKATLQTNMVGALQKGINNLKKKSLLFWLFMGTWCWK